VSIVASCVALCSPLLGETVRTAIEPRFEVVGHRCLDATAEQRGALLVFGRQGEVRSYGFGASDDLGKERGALVLEHPERTLVDTATYGDRRFVVTASPAGVQGYAIDADGVVAKTPATWIARAKCQLRVQAPYLTAFVQDVNRDGAPDVVLPTPSVCELWLATFDAEKGAPTFRKAATVSVDVTRWGARDGEFLSDQLESSFAIPNLDTRDVNGDGRPDLLVVQEQRRAFHLQRADGSFPVEPDVQVDLSIFRDTTEAANFQLGGVLTAGDRASWASRDLDHDGIPDYVIGHRRKVWVFRGGAEGPQFREPSAILKTAEDITVLSVLELDADQRPDLLIVKVQIPTLATLLRGLFGEWDVRIGALGYRNKGDATFENSPKWSNELTVRLPGIIGLAKNPEKILERFDDLEKRFRLNTRGDVDGDGKLDVLVATEDAKRVEVWIGAGASSVDSEGERKVREILFDDKNTTWDVDRVVSALGGYAQRQVALLTGGRAADRSIELRDPDQAQLGALQCADLDGDGREEIVIGYRRVANQRMALFEIVSQP